MTLSLIALTLAASAVPAHAVDIEHRGASYDVEYHAVVSTDARSLTAGPPSRRHSRRCEVTASVSVERRIAAPGSSEAIASVLTPTREFRDLSYNRCTSAGEADLVAAKSDEISDFIKKTAREDRSAALAAIDAAHALASN